MKMLFIILLAMALCITPALAEETPLYVKQVEGLPEDFIMGMDVSSVLALEACGVTYYDRSGEPKDLFDILQENGVNYIRVRVWNDPFDDQGRGYGGGNCDISAAVEIGRRATARGMKLLVDFHYSDFWADPGKQMPPKAWKNMTMRQKAPALKAYTLDCLQRLRDAGVDVGMVQLGNETNGMLCGEKNWTNIYKLMAAGAQAVREIYPQALIAVHFANPENADSYLNYAAKLDQYALDYDVFASSYYPYWHGTLENLKGVLSTIGATYSKQVMVAETSYAYTPEDGDFSGNTIGQGGTYEKPYPFTVQGQANQLADVIEAMRDIGGLGVFYWEGAWIPAGGASWEENAALWEAHGAGWASSFAGAYDPDDAGKYYGGSACDNQALFDFTGHALPSLEVFRLVRTGQAAPLKADAIDDTVLMIDLQDEVLLPQTVSAVMNDNTRQSVPVTWEAYDPQAMKEGGVKTYTIHGVADGMPALAQVAMVEYNYLSNWSFEDADKGEWTACNIGGCEQLYIEEKKSDSLTGTKHYHFYSAAQGTAEFTLEQQLTTLPEGTYRFELSIMGGDGGNTDIYTYAKVNGETVDTTPSRITSYNVWDTPVIQDVFIREGDVLTVGVYVKCSGAGNGAWGKIDDAKLNRTK